MYSKKSAKNNQLSINMIININIYILQYDAYT